MKPIYVFGHRNPDNDSICSAYAYAYLKNVTDPENTYRSARLGAMPLETQWVFDKFGLEAPELITHMHTSVADVMTEKVITVHVSQPLLEAAHLMRHSDLRALPVLDGQGRVVGMVTQRGLAIKYLEETELSGFSNSPVKLSLLAKSVNGHILVGNEDMLVYGNILIAAGEPDTLAEAITPGDVVIMGNRKRSQPTAIESEAAVLIVTTGIEPDADVLALANQKGAAVILTSEMTYGTARKITLAQSVSDVMDTELTFASCETLLSEAAEDLFSSTQRELVVINDEGACVGIVSRTDIARGGKRRCILVDHNEISQSAIGIEDATVVEIIDHHRIGDVQSVAPILFYNIPVGSTATIVTMRYEELGVEIPEGIAGVLLAALLTDTVLLKSPTSTPMDKRIAEKLAAQLGLDYVSYGMELFRARSEGRAFDIASIIRADLKEYRSGDLVAGIVQYETVDLGLVHEHHDAFLVAMEELRAAKDFDVFILMATDIVREGSEIFAVGKTRVAERALDIKLSNGSAWMDGVLSRKKQVAARFLDAAQ